MKEELEKRRSGKENKCHYRSNFEIDKQRIIFSEAFRRMQAKTQVLQLSESDFHRNRLTHSIEVATLARGIGRFLEVNKKEELEKSSIELDHDLIEAIGLAHDIGHPPFGHGGEIALNYMMRDHGGFEGNGQTLRILSKLGKYSGSHGMDLTRRTMLGILKYPCSYSKVREKTPSGMDTIIGFHNINKKEWKPLKCYFKEEEEIVEWLLNVFDKNDQKTFIEIKNKENGRNESIHKSFDCSLMDLADDIAYAMHDFEDGLELKLIPHDAIKDLISLLKQSESINKFFDKKEYDKKKIDDIFSLESPKYFSSILISFFVEQIQIKNKGQFNSPYLDCNVFLDEETMKILKCFQENVKKYIIISPETQRIELNGQIMICKLFEAFQTDCNLMPKNTMEKYKNEENNQFRVISDYISGMTDDYARKMYRRIFSSEKTSFFEK